VTFNRDLLIFVSKWTLACMLGEAIGLLVPVAIYQSRAIHSVNVAVIHGVSIGVAVGSAQWILLRRRLDYSEWWVLLTTIGWVIGYIAAIFPKSSISAVALGTIYAPPAVSMMQWLVLKRSVSRAAWWILIVSIAGGLGVYAGGLLADRWWYLLADIWTFLLFGATAGGISGLITGFDLGILLQQRPREATRSSLQLTHS